MTTIILPPEIEKSLIDQAHVRGTTPELLALEILREQVGISPATPLAESNCGTLADWLTPFIGTVHSSERVPGGAALSADSGRKFADGLATKHASGRSS